MTKKFKSLVSLIVASGLLVVGIVCTIVASINGVNKYKGIEYSHNVKIESVRTEPESLQGIVYHNVSLSGSVRNCTEEEVDLYINVVFDGVDNKTGERGEYITNLYLGAVKSNQAAVLKGDEIRVGNDKGFIPESVKHIEVVMEDGSVYRAPLRVESDGNVVLFGVAIICLLLAVVFGARWTTEFLNERKNGNKNENLN